MTIMNKRLECKITERKGELGSNCFQFLAEGESAENWKSCNQVQTLIHWNYDSIYISLIFFFFFFTFLSKELEMGIHSTSSR